MFMTESRLKFLKMRNVSDKTCRKNQYTFHIQQRFPKNRAFYVTGNAENRQRAKKIVEDDLILRRYNA